MIGTITVSRVLLDGTIKNYRYPRNRRTITQKMLSLDELLALNGKVAPKTTGIYFLLKSGSVAYIGQSVNVLIRLGQHVAAGVDFDDYRFIAVAAHDLDHQEFRYIKHFAPPLNNDARSRIRRRRMVKDGEMQNRNENTMHINGLG